MVSSRKRGREEMEAVEPPKNPSLLERIRNSWEFANLAQWIFTFGGAVKIDENLDIEDLEMECLKQHSTVLSDIGLALLKFVSSHRGLTLEIFDEYTRRQYVAKAPHRNPFGVEEVPNSFKDFDIFLKIRVLQQLTVWTMGNPDRIRERMQEQKDTEQTLWRIEPFGWDSEDRTYIVLDDNRLYRRTDPPPPPRLAAKPKKNSKKSKASRRASKRRRISEAAESDTEQAEEVEPKPEEEKSGYKEDDGLGGMIWECIAVTLEEFNTFLRSIEKSKDPNEKVLRKKITDDILPLLEKQEESRKRKQAQKERELLNLEKLATAKRSSRIAGRMEQRHHEEEQRENERKKATELAMAKKEQEKWQKLEKERESRMQTREQRLKERDARRILHEEELANLSDNSKKVEAGEARLSGRQIKAEIERKKAALQELEEDEDWIFDCICGAYGQIDDGTHSIACDKCNIWQHSKCVGVSQAEADRKDFSFICNTCERREKDAERAKTHPPIKITLKRPGSSSSPAPPKSNDSPNVALDENGVSDLASPQKDTHPSCFGHGQSIQYGGQNGNSGSHTATRISPAPGMRPPQINGSQASPQRLLATSTPAYSGPCASDANNDINALAPQSPQRSTNSDALTSPHLPSPKSLPPPGQPPAFKFSNKTRAQEATKHPSSVSTPAGSSISYTPLTASDYVCGTTPSSVLRNGPRPGSSIGDHRRSSFNMPSPLSGAPILTPNNKPSSPMTAHVSNSPLPNSTPMMGPKPSPLQPSPWEAQDQNPADSGHASALPSATTGLSPTKHSPPRQTSHGSFGSATPSIIPPVASLTPSSPLQNLSPPVKQPDGPRKNGQTAVQ
ncbi:hypothetical protein QTJ16_003977 [Diplocarpon rosae]|uniref:Zinc finger PHD-type domain-containing protein n=1 Tax=Diplocarpon rosae TaxID=946125 RepID=A0AAD9T0B8_9HELO|nr:hypothetical protein QTJ16_003977 [Diplocarpon rosae]PBP26826.1 PHD-finger domain-containing protein [Diplocarpon rosae]